MKASSIKRYLRPSTIMGRKSTISSAFASAIAPYDIYEEAAVFQAIKDLGQDPDRELACVYCGAEAATWDHVFNLVVNGDFSGHGHHIRNLVPCCRKCNESKGGKSWNEFIETLNPPDKDERKRRIRNFLTKANVQPIDTNAMGDKVTEARQAFEAIRDQVFKLMVEADGLAKIIREKPKS